VEPEDRTRLQEGLARLSLQSVYERFFRPVTSFDEQTLLYLTNVDGVNHLALGALDPTRSGSPGIGIARYVRLAEEPSIAEVAVAVLDAFQRRGLGTLLYAGLNICAAQGGVRGMRMLVLEERIELLRHLRALAPRAEAYGEGLVRLDVPVMDVADKVPDGPAASRYKDALRVLHRALKRAPSA
jgi:GNAT superfamily N-acetyltransferase